MERFQRSHGRLRLRNADQTKLAKNLRPHRVILPGQREAAPRVEKHRNASIVRKGIHLVQQLPPQEFV